MMLSEKYAALVQDCDDLLQDASVSGAADGESCGNMEPDQVVVKQEDGGGKMQTRRSSQRARQTGPAVLQKTTKKGRGVRARTAAVPDSTSDTAAPPVAVLRARRAVPPAAAAAPASPAPARPPPPPKVRLRAVPAETFKPTTPREEMLWDHIKELKGSLTQKGSKMNALKMAVAGSTSRSVLEKQELQAQVVTLQEDSNAMVRNQVQLRSDFGKLGREYVALKKEYGALRRACSRERGRADSARDLLQRTIASLQEGLQALQGRQA